MRDRDNAIRHHVELFDYYERKRVNVVHMVTRMAKNTHVEYVEMLREAYKLYRARK